MAHPSGCAGRQNRSTSNLTEPNRAGWLLRPGGHGEGPAPDPIPNSAVKTLSAYDTVPQGTGKSVAARSHQPTNRHTITHAGWSSPVARQAHNLKVTGSNPVPATQPSSTAPGANNSNTDRKHQLQAALRCVIRPTARQTLPRPDPQDQASARQTVRSALLDFTHKPHQPNKRPGWKQ